MTESPRDGDPMVWHVLLVLAVSAGYESLFLNHGLNVVDEGWPLYTAMRLHAGGTLYDDVFFVFPPGHAAVAWVSYGLSPPGVVLARSLYASFTILLCLGVYLLGRRVMPPAYALAGALLLAVAAVSAHMQQLLFGYRYLAISVFAMLAFAEYVRTQRSRWLFTAGLLTGLALVFRLTPAFAAACGIGLGILLAAEGGRRRLEGLTLYAAGLGLVALPVIAWCVANVGAEKLWLEVVTRPVAMTDQQSLPMPRLTWLPPEATRRSISIWWVALQFRAWTLLFVAYGVAVGWMCVQSHRERRPVADPVLVAVVTWGAVFFLRSFGRSDSAHLYSAIAPVCLLLAHLASELARRWAGAEAVPMQRRALAALAALGIALWVFLGGSDRALSMSYRGGTAMESLPQVMLGEKSGLLRVDDHLKTIERYARPGQTILDLSGASLFYVLTGRLGPGYKDVVMSGTFQDEAEERAFVKRLHDHPPAIVIFPGWRFDDMNERAVQRTAPLLTDWVSRHYERLGRMEQFTLMVPRGSVRREGS